MFPTMREVFMSTTIECGKGADASVSQKLLESPSIALEQSLPALELSQVTVHPVRGIAADTTSATAGLAGIISSRTPSNVALVPTARGCAGWTSCGAANDSKGCRDKERRYLIVNSKVKKELCDSKYRS